LPAACKRFAQEYALFMRGVYGETSLNTDHPGSRPANTVAVRPCSDYSDYSAVPNVTSTESRRSRTDGFARVFMARTRDRRPDRSSRRSLRVNASSDRSARRSEESNVFDFVRLPTRLWERVNTIYPTGQADLLRFLAGCRTSRLNQALSVMSFSLGFF